MLLQLVYVPKSMRLLCQPGLSKGLKEKTLCKRTEKGKKGEKEEAMMERFSEVKDPDHYSEF